MDDEILFKDLCLIYTISVIERPDENTVLRPNVNDDLIGLCNEASDREYRFLEEGYYDIPAWEFCFRKAFGTYKSYPRPPNLGEIKKKGTCDELKGFKDECLWLVAMKTEDIAICDLMSDSGRIGLCKETLNISEEPDDQTNGTGIIKGNITLRTYRDCMPCTCAPPPPPCDCPDSCFNVPVSNRIMIRDIFVVNEPFNVKYAELDESHFLDESGIPPLIATAYSDENGSFEIEVPVGTYYFFIEFEEGKPPYIDGEYCPELGNSFARCIFEMKKDDLQEYYISLDFVTY